jgi:hypothetical protein
MTSYSPGTSMRMLRSDLGKVNLADGAAQQHVSDAVKPALLAVAFAREGGGCIRRLHGDPDWTVRMAEGRVVLCLQTHKTISSARFDILGPACLPPQQQPTAIPPCSGKNHGFCSSMKGQHVELFSMVEVLVALSGIATAAEHSRCNFCAFTVATHRILVIRIYVQYV